MKARLKKRLIIEKLDEKFKEYPTSSCFLEVFNGEEKEFSFIAELIKCPEKKVDNMAVESGHFVPGKISTTSLILKLLNNDEKGRKEINKWATNINNILFEPFYMAIFYKRTIKAKSINWAIDWEFNGCFPCGFDYTERYLEINVDYFSVEL